MARFAERMYKRRNDHDAQRIVQQLLHHRDPESQRDYTDIDFDHIRACAARMMPEPKKKGRPVKNG
jgi:site-specific recombinase XerC